MRQTLKTLCRIAFSQAIAEKAMEKMDSDNRQTEIHYYRDMFQKACEALKVTPGTLPRRDCIKLDKVLNEFTTKMDWDKPRNIHILLNFSIELLEELSEKSTDPIRKKCLDALIASEMRIYNYFAAPTEDQQFEYIDIGLTAVKEWKTIVEGEQNERKESTSIEETGIR